MKCITCDQEALSDSDSCTQCEQNEFSKISSILWLPAMGLVVGLVMYIISITNTANIIGIIRENAPQLTSLIWFELISQILLALLAIYTAFLFFNRRKGTATAYIILLLLIVTYRIADSVLVTEYYGLGKSFAVYGQITPAILGALIWVPYFLKSVRVKRTFVR